MDFEATAKIVASVVALLGAYVTIAKYLQEKRKANESARIEAAKPFSTKQQEIYLELVKTTAILSNRQGHPEWEEAAKNFWVMFWGVIPMVADRGVAVAIDQFAATFDKVEDEIAMRNASMDLARACRKSLGESWNTDFQLYAKSDRAGMQ